MEKLVESSGIVIYKAGNKLHISKSSSIGTSTFLFVLALLAIILLANGVLQLTVFKDQLPDSEKLGYILMGIGIIFFFIFLLVWKQYKKQAARPLQLLHSICIVDIENNMLLDSQLKMLAPINEAYITRKMQITSSSPELLLCWNGGTLSLAKGNPFSGGIASLEKVLVANGIKRK